jgi:hypothetical protein
MHCHQCHATQSATHQWILLLRTPLKNSQLHTCSDRIDQPFPEQLLPLDLNLLLRNQPAGVLSPLLPQLHRHQNHRGLSCDLQPHSLGLNYLLLHSQQHQPPALRIPATHILSEYLLAFRYHMQLRWVSCYFYLSQYHLSIYRYQQHIWTVRLGHSCVCHQWSHQSLLCGPDSFLPTRTYLLWQRPGVYELRSCGYHADPHQLHHPSSHSQFPTHRNSRQLHLHLHPRPHHPLVKPNRTCSRFALLPNPGKLQQLLQLFGICNHLLQQYCYNVIRDQPGRSHLHWRNSGVP